ncbi:hypothetical protein WJX81_003445 [Elliptochloris bilobata]|uniref:Uncharacterized protein n=1 Tax=Elliptochloris bilobata TaxID=381761 RepID=A0AAW1S9K4_9CHLO
MTGALAALAAANVARHAELDWRAQNDALSASRRLVARHAGPGGLPLGPLLAAAVPAVDALRSQTARAAMLLLQEAFLALGPGADGLAEAAVGALLRRAGELGVAGRPGWLAGAADAALAAAVCSLSEARVAGALLSGAGQRSAGARAKAAMHLDGCLAGARGARLAAHPGALSQALGRKRVCNEDILGCMLERLAAAAAGFLEEGSADARAAGRRLIWRLARLAGGREGFARLLARAPGGPERTRRAIESLDACMGPEGLMSL